MFHNQSFDKNFWDGRDLIYKIFIFFILKRDIVKRKF